MNNHIFDIIQDLNSRAGLLWTETDKEELAQLIVQDCANFIREHYDSWDAEPLAWDLELRYGLHGDYA